MSALTILSDSGMLVYNRCKQKNNLSIVNPDK